MWLKDHVVEAVVWKSFVVSPNPSVDKAYEAVVANEALVGYPFSHTPESYIRACPLTGDTIVTSDRSSNDSAPPPPPLPPPLPRNKPAGIIEF